jgi:predicted phosphodiesterase
MYSPRHSLTKWIVALVFVGIFSIRALSSYQQQNPRNDFHFSLIGDRTGDAQPQIFGRVWREVDLLRPDFIVTVGDTIQGGKEDRAEGEWAELRPLWKRYSHYPIYFTPGNHDIWSKTSETLYIKETGKKPFYSFDYQDAHFTILDNSRTRELSEEQMQFLESDLKANQARSPKFIVFHKPFWIAPLQAGTLDLPLHQLAKKYGVNHVISGHGHRFVRIVREGIAYMEVGSSGGGMDGSLRRGDGFRNGCFYHHVWARVKGGEVFFTIRELDGPFGEGRMFSAEQWDENGPKFDTGDPALDSKPQT